MTTYTLAACEAHNRSVIVELGPDWAREARDFRRKVRGYPMQPPRYPYTRFDELLIEVFPELA